MRSEALAAALARRFIQVAPEGISIQAVLAGVVISTDGNLLTEPREQAKVIGIRSESSRSLPTPTPRSRAARRQACES
jgi:hypothetical protein